MTGREKMFAVLRGNGTSDFPVVIPYAGILLRDQWSDITNVDPQEYRSIHIDAYLQAWEDFFSKIDMDWVPASPGRPEKTKDISRENNKVQWEWEASAIQTKADRIKFLI